MKVSTKLLCILLSLILSFIGAIMALRYWQARNVAFVLENREFETGRWSDKILELRGRSLADITFDYTYWDDMVEFVKSADPAFAEANIETGFKTFGAQAVWVFDLDSKLVYYNGDPPTDAIRDALLPANAHNTL